MLGVVEMTNEEYHADTTAISSSGLRTIINKSPRHFKLGQRKETEAMAIGTACHTALLEPEKFRDTYTQKPENMSFATKEGKAWREDNQHKKILSFDNYEMCRGMYKSVYGNKILRPILDTSKKELTYFWKDKETGVLMKMRLDILTQENNIIDLKTTESAAEQDFKKSMHNYAYAFQAMFYMEGAKDMLDLSEYPFFEFWAIEKEAPYEMAIYTPGAESLKRAYIQLRNGLNIYKNCLETNEWPGYDLQAKQIEEPYFG
jgi:hypothetical protein